jgi:predicted RNase H-like HicB family nuclease
MKMVHAVIEPSKDGYGLYYATPSLEGITSFGETLDEVKENALTVLKELVEVYTENKETLPEDLLGVNLDELKIKFSFDLRYYFEHYSYLNLTEFARKIKINPSLLRQYRKGLAYSSEKQFQEIRNGFHFIAKELQAVI